MLPQRWDWELIVYNNELTCLFPTSGIYGLVYNNKIIYIGQARDMEKRLDYHFNTNTGIRTILAEQEENGFGTKYD